ncbi:hypothetical protein [Micromonospora sp. RTGN7]|uniref:hypothetical protein n=1 Tax=Micromonospora sp. RTGN7 TaxID=3016526 RepID=UPI0029FF11DC|nr:hypothetical protein [Micromonospora sp. RTGN7]
MRVPSVIGRPAALAMCAGLLGLVAGGLAYRQATAGPTVDDGARIYCLSAEHRAGLAEAAVALDLAEPGPSADLLTWRTGLGDVEQWRDDRRADFDRACLGLLAATRQGGSSGGGSSPWSTVAPSLVLAVASAVLAAWFSRRQATTGVRRAEADSLRTAGREYRRATEALLRELEQARPGLPPDDGEVRKWRLELVGRLNAVADARRGWELPRRLSDALDEEPVGPRAVPGGRDPQRRAEWIGGQRDALRQLATEVEQVAQAVQHSGFLPGRPPASVR